MQNTDVIVVGGGIYGCSLTHQLARSGVRVTLLERDEIASGASGGPGFRGVRANDRDIRELPLMRLAYDIWPGLDEELGVDAGYRRIGGLCLFEAETSEDPLSMARIQATVAAQNAHGIPTELIGRARLLELEPGVGDSVTGAVHTPLDGVADHPRATRAYARAAIAHGASIFEHSRVVEVEVDGPIGGAVTLADGARYQADRAVVVLANSYAPELVSHSLAVDLPVWRYNPQMTPVRSRNGFVLRHLVSHVTRTFSAKTIEDEMVMLSGGRSGTWDWNTDSGHAEPTVAQASSIDAAALFPELRSADVVLTDASRPESVSVDGVPIIDQLPHAPSVFIGTGWSGHGFAIAPAVSQLLAQWILGGDRPPALSPFSLARMGAAVRTPA